MVTVAAASRNRLGLTDIMEDDLYANIDGNLFHSGSAGTVEYIQSISLQCLLCLLLRLHLTSLGMQKTSSESIVLCNTCLADVHLSVNLLRV